MATHQTGEREYPLPPGRDSIPLNHPRRIAQIAHLSERELAHESVEVRQLCRDFREKPLRAAYARAIAAVGEANA